MNYGTWWESEGNPVHLVNWPYRQTSMAKLWGNPVMQHYVPVCSLVFLWPNQIFRVRALEKKHTLYVVCVIIRMILEAQLLWNWTCHSEMTETKCLNEYIVVPRACQRSTYINRHLKGPLKHTQPILFLLIHQFYLHCGISGFASSRGFYQTCFFSSWNICIRDLSGSCSSQSCDSSGVTKTCHPCMMIYCRRCCSEVFFVGDSNADLCLIS